jgi:O-antigen ligase
MKNFAVILMMLYLGTSPVYWFPYLDVSLFSLLKFVLIALPVVLIWSISIANGRFLLPTGMIGPIGLLVLIVSATFAFAQAKEGLVVKRLMDMLLGFAMMWSFYLYSRNNADIHKILRNAAIIIAILCWITVFNRFLDMPAWRSPVVFGANPLSVSGFGALRTGWSNGVALFVPVLLLLLSDYRTTILSAVTSMALIAGIVMSQIIVAGRAGLLTSLAAVSIYAVFKLKKIYLVIAAAIVVILVITFFDFFVVQFRIDRLEGDGMSTEALDHFSAGRIESYLTAIKMAVESPLVGYGFGEAIVGDREIHNFWLRMLVEGGMFLPLVFLVIVLAILKRVKAQMHMLKRMPATESATISRRLYKARSLYFCLFLILLGGLIESFFEPNIFLGSFQNTAIWWAAAGIALAMHDPGEFDSHARESISDKQNKVTSDATNPPVNKRHSSVRLRR